jgi:asparagine synthase (glutamine-hydrolysing)
VRRFWARDPSSKLRPLLLKRLNRWLATDPARAGAFLTRFYGQNLESVDDPLYSHRLRFANTGRCLRLLSAELLEAAAREGEPAERLIRRLPARFESFSPLAKAQYLETVTFFEGYLLHSQGDRMLMGHSIEGRFPFVDVRLAELAGRLPDSLRLRGLKEKYALRRAVAPYLDEEIRSRPKVPYRAPIREVFFGERRPDYASELLRPERVAETGLFDPAAVARVTAKFEAAQDGGVSETDEMALVGAVSLLVLHERMVRAPTLARPLEPTRVVVGADVVGDTWADQVAEAI